MRALIVTLCLAALASDVPEPFRAAVERDARGGRRIAATHEVSSVGKRFLAVVFDGAREGDDRTLRLYFVPDGATAPTSIELYSEQIVTFGTYEAPEAVAADLNGDGRKELIAIARRVHGGSHRSARPPDPAAGAAAHNRKCPWSP